MADIPLSALQCSTFMLMTMFSTKSTAGSTEYRSLSSRTLGCIVASAVTKPLEELPAHFRVYSTTIEPIHAHALFKKATGRTPKVVPESGEKSLAQAGDVIRNGFKGRADLFPILIALTLEGAADFTKYNDNQYLNLGCSRPRTSKPQLCPDGATSLNK